ncbi:hypothetical protein PV08_00996 [Exophiala spinifera]|uniref:Uncharacterized protein n=1 Tax=Exophiala spinifera TaxID=91928 RepID=A0A0D1YYQ4_9EURO|nr:uncharacterized protein PV08_00996 [Exophiala spinifera]KIW20421.1 hypothetical protein PV08_00996 [Exophiala spinifera]
MSWLWRREHPCTPPNTITITQTILQGAATSRITSTDSALSTLSAEFTFGAINFGQGDSSRTPGASATDSGSLLTSGFAGTPPVTSITLSSTVPTTKTIHLVSASASATSSATSSACPTQSSSSSSSKHSGAIAGGVLGGMAGVALILLLLLWCSRRHSKFKLTFKRKMINTVDEQKREDAVQQERGFAMQRLEQNHEIPSPRSFDFGLPKVPQNSTPIMPKQWI